MYEFLEQALRNDCQYLDEIDSDNKRRVILGLLIASLLISACILS